MELVLKIVKSPEVDYNANSIAKQINITSMGALKILKKIEKEEILTKKQIGQAAIYKLNKNSCYAEKYVSLLLSRERIYAEQQIKRWIEELKKIKNAELIILFGSVLNKPNPNDIDVLLVTSENKYSLLQKEIKVINDINIKKIHPLYQTEEDLINNIKIKHPPILSAIKGIIIKGEDKFIEVYHESRRE